MNKPFYIAGHSVYKILEKSKLGNISFWFHYSNNSLSSYEFPYDIDEYDCIIAYGGGSVIDYAKYVAAGKKLYLEVHPTILSTDAMFTDVSIVRCPEVVYLKTKAPDRVILDYDLLEEVDWRLHVGSGDVLSIITALRSWRKCPSYEGYIAKEALEIVDKLKRPDDRVGIDTLFNCLREEVLLCKIVGTSQVEEGLEHEFAYCFEKYAVKKVLHCQLVVLGMLCAAKVLNMSDKEIEDIKNRFCKLGLVWDSKEIGLNLPEYFKLMAGECKMKQGEWK